MDDLEDRVGLSEPPDIASLPPHKEPPLPGRIRGARYLVAGLLLAIIATVVTSTYLRIESQLRQTLEGELKAVLAENVHAVSRWLERNERLAKKTASLDAVVDIAQLYVGGTAERRSPDEELAAALEPLIKTKVLDGVALHSTEGQLLLASNPDLAQAQLNLESGREEDLTERGISSRIFRTSDGVAMETLVYVGKRESPLAILAFRPHLSQSLLPRALRKGSTYVFDDASILGGRNAGSDLRALPTSARELWTAPSSPAGTFVEDYVGAGNLPVVGAWSWIEKYRVGVVTEVPQDEALGSIARLRRSFLVLVTLVGAAVLGFIALGRWTLRVREESVLMTRRLGRLARAIQPLSAALEHDPSAVVLVDAEGVVVYANAASHRVLGVSTPLLGQDVDEVFDHLHAELHAALISGRDSIVAQGTGTEDETLLVSSRTLTIDGNPHFLYMLRPVTQQVRRQEVEHWKKLIRVLSHELNNALAPITSLLSSARKVNQMSHQDARLGEIFESISERTGHLVSFIEGYREVARLPRPDQRPIDWSDFMAGLESQKKFVLSGSLPQRPGYFDPVQLERVLVNVVNNSHEAGSDPEEVTLEVLEEPGGFRVNVLDRGAGMPEPVLKQAMLPFFSTKRTGTGVGLALSREIIEAHGGQLTLANREGGGLVVSCFLPHPVQPAAHPSRSRLPVSPPVSSESDSSELSDPVT